MRRSCLLMCLVIGLGVHTRAQVLYVPADHSSIQAGIDAAEPGDTVLVDEGTYFENIDFRGKALTLASHFLIDMDTTHISHTIIDGSRATDLTRASVVTFRSGEDSTSVLCGFTITGGTGTFLTDVHIDEYMRKWRNMCGGGIVIHRSGAKILHNIIENNLVQTDTVRGAYGGGIMANVNDGRTAIIRGNIIRDNHIRKRMGWGAGICLFGGSILIEDNAILENLIDARYLAVGGGIFFQNDSTVGGIQQVVIRHNVIAGNKTFSMSDEAMGGGIALCFGFYPEVVEILHNIISENHTSGIGGGIHSFSGRGLLSGNLIIDNTAAMYGGPIAVEQQHRLVLLDNHIWSGNVWLATSYGLNRVHFDHAGSMKMARMLEPLDQAKGEFYSIDPGTGSIYIGKRKGMLSFRPEAVPIQTFAPPMVIMDFRKLEAVLPASGEKQLDLSHRENFVKFKFSVLELYDEEYGRIYPDYRFRYMMKGWDQDSATTGMDMTAQYQNLKPGRYTFGVARSPANDNLEPMSLSLLIRIHPPWYRSGLALGFYVVFLALLISGITSFRTLRLRREKLRLEKEVARRTEELREKNAQIIEMQRLKTRFFTDISHEIRTPLSLIAGPLDQLINQEYRDPRIFRWLSLIRRNSLRLITLVNQLLDISRLDAGRMKLVLEKSDVIAHLRLFAGEFFSLAESNEIRYLVDIPDMSLNTFYDKEKLEKVCANLLSNAFKFTPSHGTVTFRLKILKDPPHSKNPRIRLIVADTGTGIPADMQSKVFDRFYRGEGESNRLYNGTGLGLSLTRELVRIMHGDIVFKSKLGEGTVFMVTLPSGWEHLGQEEYILKESDEREDGNAPPEDNSLLPRTEIQKNSKISILVVEDNKDLQAFIMENLVTEFRVQGATNGRQGLSIAMAELPDLIITDVMMPGDMDGMELCNRLKNDERTSHIPVVMLTAKSTTRNKIEGLKLGADDYIIKPFSMDELQVRIGNLLKQRERLRKKYANLIEVDWEQISVTTLEDKFLRKVLGIISENMRDFNFNVGRLEEMMFMSREHIFRKLKALTGESPSSLIRVMRLKAAASLLERGEESITGVSMQVGFSNPSYFSQCFKAYYGRSPSEHVLKKPAGYSP